MKNGLLKIKRIVKEGFMDLRDFGIKVMIARMYCTYSEESIKGIWKKNEAILRYLKRNFSDILEKYQDKEETGMPVSTSNAPIWVFWWQGQENMPEVIRMCHESRIRNCCAHPIILLTEKNIKEYVDFPEFVWSQFENKKLRIQHLADMIRVQLIRKHGGLWLDASIYCMNELDESIFHLPLYSLKGEMNERYVSNNQWTTFVIGGMKNNVLCSFLDDFFIEYCRTGKRFIDYFMFDCAIALAYENIRQVKIEIDKLPREKGDYYWLNKNLDKVVSNQMLKDCKQYSSTFQKIAWNRVMGGKDETQTLYGYLLKKSDE